VSPDQDPDARANEPEALDVLRKHSDEEVGFLQTVQSAQAGARRSLRDPPGRGVEGVPETDELPPCARSSSSSRRFGEGGRLSCSGAEEDDRVRVYQSCVFVKPPGSGRRTGTRTRTWCRWT
jgi:hypothetical protein